MRVFVGWDPAEDDAFRVCRSSILRHQPRAKVEPIVLQDLRDRGVYQRQHYRQGVQLFDHITKQSFTTEFTFSRYLVPALAGWQGWALFCDCDFLFKADVEALFDMADEDYAVMVVKQSHEPADTVKMLGQAQSSYPRKNWASLVLWNCGHSANREMVRRANNWQKDYLHAFTWLEDKLIGELPTGWNWIEGLTEGEPKAVHFTAGLPRMPGYENAAYAEDWFEELARVEAKDGELRAT